MKYKDWVLRHWEPTLVSDDPDFILQMEKEKQLNIERIEKYFSKKIMQVVQISKETFVGLPAALDDPAWPNFTPIMEWLEKNMRDEWFQYDPVNYIFANDIDAMAFKLRWG